MSFIVEEISLRWFGWFFLSQDSICGRQVDLGAVSEKSSEYLEATTADIGDSVLVNIIMIYYLMVVGDQEGLSK